MKAIRICLLLGAVILLLTGVGPEQTYAAGAIDLPRPCSLTLYTRSSPESGEAGEYADLYSIPRIGGKLYRVADVSFTGAYRSRAPFEALNIPALTAPDKEAWASLWEDTADKAAAIVEALPSVSPDASVTLTPTEDGSGILGTVRELDPGMYLVILEDAQSPVFTYRFRPFLAAVPGNLYWETQDESKDAWIYDVSAALKPEWERRTGKLIIRKTVERYADMDGSADFVFLVESRDADGKILYSNVVTIRHQDAGTQEAVLTDVPAGLTVTVTEVYSGASYTLVSEPSQSVTVTTQDTGEDPATVAFVNTWNGKLTQDIAAVNRFTYTQDEQAWVWQTRADNNSPS